MTEFTYAGSDGWPLYVAAVDSSGGPAAGGENPVLVLLHGRRPHHRSLLPLARRLAAVTAPTVIIPGMDERHPTASAEALARILPKVRLAPVTLTGDLRSAEDFARAFAPPIRDFLADVAHRL